MKTPYSAKKARKIKVPGTNTSCLTVTSKMPGPSFSLPAGRACPNSHGEVCEHCYAQKGCYRYASTRQAQETRFRWTVEAMRSPEARAQWITRMVAAIAASGVRYFRGHDSGDFFSVAYAECWLEVATRLPHVRFWFPTREYQLKPGPFAILSDNPRLSVIRALAALPNVTVRPSALSVGAAAPVVDGLAAGSTVACDDAFQCDAYRRDGHCGACRVCWNRPDVAVSYPLH